jgi:hypothetical protein
MVSPDRKMMDASFTVPLDPREGKIFLRAFITLDATGRQMDASGGRKMPGWVLAQLSQTGGHCCLSVIFLQLETGNELFLHRRTLSGL